MSEFLTDLSQKVVIVTGGARGIGEEMVRQFANYGAKVAVIDIDKSNLEKSNANHQNASQIHKYQCDLTDEKKTIETFNQIKKDLARVDVLINNAMFHDPTDYLNTTLESWNKTLAVNLTAPFLTIRTVLPWMIAQKGGSIINLGTVNAKAMIGSDSYSVSKGGVHVLTRTVAMRYGANGVRCNTLVPGTVATDAWQERIDKNPTIFAQVKEWYPLGRVGTPLDIANAALFLASEKSNWITGTEFLVDGGLLSGYNPMFKLVEGSDRK